MLSEAARDRGTLLTGVALLAIAAVAWAGVLVQATMGDMEAMGGADGSMAMAGGMAGAGPSAAPAFLASWLVMMMAMMLPSALPMVLLYRTVARGRTGSGHATGPTWIFVLGYLLIWGLFGVPVYLASLAVDAAVAADPMVVSVLPYAAAAVLVAAGAYQFTPLKQVCLRKCRGPLGFLMERWRDGRGGALRMGAEHGAYCVGCCWGLMAVLVAAGAMGLAWVSLIALAVFVEKLLPRGELAARLVGAGLTALGVIVAANPALVMALRA